ncbi:hypothetical protein [Desulfopila sp. IMCC35008]|uniref:hypothetical protein n=1 Tax=Desulfopila sp. IMCC35008 TaxID=2653858 RepID=UPI0013D40BDC|nr:hypothetical protein [Desulfopila sp. IMCC35008]
MISVVAVGYIIFTPYYLTNDGLNMRFLAEGNYANMQFTPSDFLMFTSPIYGLLLHNLYLIFPDIYWYDLMFSFSSLLSLLIFLLCVSSYVNSLNKFIVVYIFIVCFFSKILYSPQFTFVSGSLALAAVVIISEALIAEARSKLVKYLMYMSYCFVVALSLLIRSKMLYLIMVTGIVLLLLQIVINHKINKHIIHTFIQYVITFLLLACSLLFAEKNYYNFNIENQKKYDLIKLNAMRALIHDGAFTLDDHLKGDLKHELENRNGWSVNDYLMIRTWMMVNPEIYNISSFNENLAVISDKVTKKYNLKESIYSTVFLLSQSYDKYILYIFSIVFFIFVYGQGFITKYNAITIGIVVVEFFLLSIWIKVLPIRVWYILFLVTFWFVIYFSNERKKEPECEYNNCKKYLNIAFFVLFFACITFSDYVQNRFDGYYRLEALGELDALDKEAVYVNFGGLNYATLLVRPFNDRQILSEFKFINVGTNGLIPQIQDSFKKYGLVDYEKSLCDNDSVYLKGRSYYENEYDRMFIFKTFMKEHYGQEVHFEEIFNSKRFSYVRCVTKKNN